MPSIDPYSQNNKKYNSRTRSNLASSTNQRDVSVNRRGITAKKAYRHQRGATVKGAQNKLKQFRQASILAVALTGILLLILAPGEAGYSQQTGGILSATEQADVNQNKTNQDSISNVDDGEVNDREEELSKAAKDEAVSTFKNLWDGFYSNLPKILVAVITLVFAWLFVRLVRFVLKKTISRWSNSDAVITLTGIVVWLLAIGMAVSVVAGDIRALIGSLGLVGLALSWSLQTPIESFTAWLQNSFQRYYRVGDRISVGEVFGDVYKIDFLTTTVWEIGAPYKQGFVQAEQPTGRLVTFPNSEILSGTVVNLTRDFPFVWDELAVAVANESDILFSMKVIENIAITLLQDYMQEPARKYTAILREARLEFSIAEKPEVFISAQESWTNITIRYLVGARERRKWKSDLNLRLSEELSKKVHKGKIIPVYPRQQLQFIKSNGQAFEPEFMQHKEPEKS